MATPSATLDIPADDEARTLPPVLSRLLRGTFWQALRAPLQAVFALWTIPLIVNTVGEGQYGAFGFAWGFGFLQFLLEFGMSSAIQKEVSACWTRGDREGVDRAVASGLNFYTAVAVLQAAVLLAVAYFGVPDTWTPIERRLIVRLLWLQALTSPCFGLSVVISALLQAARRYDVLPRFEFAGVIGRFAVLYVGLTLGFDYFAVVAVQTVLGALLVLAPGLWIVRRELAYRLPLRAARFADYASLLHISAYMFLIQLSVVLADRIDTMILGYVLETPGPAVAVYQAVGKPFLQLRQTGWMLAYFVMPAVASLAAVRDEASLERIKYDGTRLLVGVVLPVGLLAAIYAHPFLELWVAKFAGDYRLMQLFLVAALPLVLSVLVQMAIGIGAIRVVALAALAGALVNLPLSYYLTLKLGVSGVIWGTVLTTLASNLIVPGIHVFRVLGVRVGTFVRRSLGAPMAGSIALVAASLAMRSVLSPEPGAGSIVGRAGPLCLHLAVSSVAYLLGYLAVPSGRGDLATLSARLRRAG